MKFTNHDGVVTKIGRIPKVVKDEMRVAMVHAADEILAMQRAAVPMEAPPGSHADRKKHPYGAGTLKAALRWSWFKGADGPLKIVFSDIPWQQPNLGLWIERGTRPGTKGESYRATGWVSRKKRSYGSEGISTQKFVTRKRKIYRSHPGTAPHPYFFSAWRAMLPRVGAEMAEAWRTAIGKALS